jgi:hypothetical protein
MISLKGTHFPKDVILYAVFLVLSQALVKAKSALLLILAGFATMIDICQVKYLVTTQHIFFLP